MKFTKNDDAVSELIANILLVSLTILMAGIIAASLVDMTGSLQKTRIIAATASHNAGSIIITYYGGPDSGEVTVLTAKIGSNVSTFNPSVGSELKSAGNYTGTQNHVVVNATFIDGSEQVILDTYV